MKTDKLHTAGQKKSRSYSVAVIGATGSVGYRVLAYLEEREFPLSEIYAVGGDKSVGKQVSFKDENLPVLRIDEIDFSKIDFAFFCTSAEVSRKYAPVAASKGCTVIDKSSFFRLDKDVPLIVPEANIGHLRANKDAKIIANPNCCTIPLAVVLKPLDNEAKIKRVVISTYQSVSGAGKEALDELYDQTKAKYVYENLPPKVFSQPIAFNLFPHIGDFIDDGRTEEEDKIEKELSKIIGEHLVSSVTCVRVPVFVSHCMSVNIEFVDEMSASEAEEILQEADGVIVYNHLNEIKYATPVETVEYDEVFVSRVREDKSQKNTINMWVVTDNLRKGAALNAIQLAEEIIKIRG